MKPAFRYPFGLLMIALFLTGIIVISDKAREHKAQTVEANPAMQEYAGCLDEFSRLNPPGRGTGGHSLPEPPAPSPQGGQPGLLANQPRLAPKRISQQLWAPGWGPGHSQTVRRRSMHPRLHAVTVTA